MGRKKNLLKGSRAPRASKEPVPLTFMGHLRELRRRLFWTALWFVVATGVIFPFYHDIIHILMQPLGNEKLYFLSPIGGLSFAMKICMYVGVIATLPVLIYNLYRFISPAMPNHRARQAIGYVTLSIVLAALGILFAYTVSLPSAVYFLTHFDLGDISAMLTVDAYLSFIVSYVLAGAILFQLPLIMMIVDNITPTPPSMWNKYQRHMIVAALVIAMLITPVPDIINQFILAAPIVVMYQFGIFMVYLRHKKRRKAEKMAQAPVATPAPAKKPVPTPVLQEVPVPKLASPMVTAARVVSEPPVTSSAPAMRRSIDGVYRKSSAVQQPRPLHLQVSIPARPAQSGSAQKRPTRLTTIDGFFPART